MRVNNTKALKKCAAETKNLSSRIRKLATSLNKVTLEAKTAQTNDAWHSELFLQSQNIILAFMIDDDMPGKIIAANNAACLALEFTREELYQKPILDIEIIDETYLQQSAISKRKTPITLSNALNLGSDSTTAGRAMQLTIQRIIKEKKISYKSGYKTKTGKHIPVKITAQISSYNGDNVIICNTRNQLPQTELKNALSKT